MWALARRNSLGGNWTAMARWNYDVDGCICRGWGARGINSRYFEVTWKVDSISGWSQGHEVEGLRTREEDNFHPKVSRGDFSMDWKKIRIS